MTRTYPGMIDHSIEYFTQNGEVYKSQSGKTEKFTNAKHPELESLLENEPNLKPVLSEMCNGNHYLMLRKLAECRFGGLNFEADFADGKFTQDYCDCPLRGKCMGENIVCKPIEINGEPVTETEIKVLRHCASNEKNLSIASLLNIPFGTLNVLKTHIYTKCGFVTKQQSAIALFEKGLL